MSVWGVTISLGPDDHLGCALSRVSHIPFRDRRTVTRMLRLKLVRPCPVRYIRHYHARSTTPSKGDKGTSPSIAPFQGLQRVHAVVVAMSGGVDSSVTAKLLADAANVSPVLSHRIAPSSCCSGIRPLCSIHAELGHARRIWVGRRMRVEEGLGGRAESLSDARLTRHDGACVLPASPTFVSQARRSTSVGNTGSGCSSHPSKSGLQDFRRIPTSGATSETLSYVTFL
jgi:hypothetical protein